MLKKNFPEYYNHLKDLIGGVGKEIPGAMSGFAHPHRETVAEGELSTKMKELIALGIAISVRCDGCVSYHVHDALSAGAQPTGDRRDHQSPLSPRNSPLHLDNWLP